MARNRLSAGRFLECLADIKTELEEFGYQGYDFILPHVQYPRCCLKPGSIGDKLPEIDRPDLQLPSNEWGRLVVGSISSWIDVDSEDEQLRKLSVKAFKEEVNYFSYLCLPAITIELKRYSQPNLAKMMNEFVEPAGGPMVWVVVPMSAEEALQTPNVANGHVIPNGVSECEGDAKNDHESGINKAACSSNDDEENDTWHWFYNFRSACDNKQRLALCLKLSTDLPEDDLKLKRWLGEPIKSFIIDTRQFITNQQDFPVLTKPHQNFIQQLFTLNAQAMISGPQMHNKRQKSKPTVQQTEDDKNVPDESKMCVYFSYLNHLYKTKPVDVISDFALGYEDCLQVPLQPLGDNLESQIYETFEKDPIKYAEYKRATIEALLQIVKQSGSSDGHVVVMVLGAGRGPLVTAAIEAVQSLGLKVRMFAVEKNPNAIITLTYLNKTKWNGQVTIVESDMRNFIPKEEDKADIVISELLGSFGDNELSPECLDGALHLMKDGCISIPKSYTSYITPIHSPKLYQTVRQQASNEYHPMMPYESSYVVRVLNHFLPSDIKPLFTFSHPNKDLSSNDRYKELKFVAKETCELTGLIGFFHAELYPGVNLSILPERHTSGLFSWFPILFPFKNQVFVKKGEEIVVNFWRCSNARQVWYEWSLRKPIQTPIMNVKGRSSYIRKI